MQYIQESIVWSSESRCEDFDGFRRFPPSLLIKSGFLYTVVLFILGMQEFARHMSVLGESEHSG
jgi:hypothetical protein